MAKVYTYVEANKVLDEAVPLVTQANVLSICKEVDEETPTEELDIFIKGAHLIVCEQLDGYGLSTDRITMIEHYLAAHLAAVTYTPSAFEAVGKVQVSYSTKIALNLDLTRYGQQAKMFDPTGQLANMNKETSSKRFDISWGGLDKREMVSGGGVYAITEEN